MGTRLHKAFVMANGVQNLLRLADEAYHHVPVNTQNLIATFASQLLSAIGWSVYEQSTAIGYHSRSEYHRGVLTFFDKYNIELFDLSKAVDAGTSRDLIQYFSTLLSDLCHWDEKIASDLVDRFLDFRDPESPTTPTHTESDDVVDFRQDPASFSILVSNAWKFKILRKYVVKGKMDLRVMSIAMMDTALVDLWREYSNIDPTCKHPVMQHLANFLLHGQVVDYIVSVDSHPQLISRSGNIVGFLVVTHRWSINQADSIWNTVSENPDPRVVAATMTMLRGIVGLMPPSDQLHLCRKLYDMPIEKYTLDILRFLRDITAKYLEKVSVPDYDMEDGTVRPWNVCIRMICDTAPYKEIDKHSLDLHNEASEQLRTIAHVVPAPERHVIYRECARHIADHSPKATGSFRVIYQLAAPLPLGVGLFFEQHQELTCQILQEIPFAIATESKVSPHPHQIMAVRYRLEFLALIICRAAPAIPTSLYEELWDHTIGEHALSNTARDIAWVQLAQTMKASPRNDFCQQLVLSYIPKMNPRLYTAALFEFVANFSFPITRERIDTEKGDETVLQIPGAHLLWSMILSAPQGTIEDRAARLLAARYVQIADSEDVLLSEVEHAHIALVNKCMQEIRSAAKLLRTKQQDNVVACDEVAATSDDKIQECEVRFGRILLFQKLLLEFVRQKPEFNRGQRSDSKVDEADIPYGDAITIRYQCGNDRQSVIMATEHTLSDLHKRLCYTTGYTKINLFAKGQRLHINQIGSQKLSETDFGGQLLIQRAEGAEVTGPLAGQVAGSSIYETTVVKYFDELFALMDSEDPASSMVNLYPTGLLRIY